MPLEKLLLALSDNPERRKLRYWFRFASNWITFVPGVDFRTEEDRVLMAVRRLWHAFVYSLLFAIAIVSLQLPFRAQVQKQLRPSVRKITKRGPQDTAESILGERLFLETRFAQYFAAHAGSDVNRSLSEGDPVVAHIQNPRAGVRYPSPFAGKSINCRTCHLVDECNTFVGGINRTYADFTQRSLLPARSDGRAATVRNARAMVDNFTPRRSFVLLHADGEFATAAALAKSVMLGRTFGWLLSEHDAAIHHVARVIREDDGRDTLGQQYGGSYAKLLRATDADIPEALRLSPRFRMDVTQASDEQIVDEVARLIEEFLKTLRFEQTAQGIHSGSAYDMFLAKNNLPFMPDKGESDVAYSQRLLSEIEKLQNPRFIVPYERWLRFHPHVMQFGEQELAGLKIFLRSAGQTHTGNCLRCHPAPDFTDERFHNTGGAQEEYDAVHGAGAFARLPIPSYEERRREPERYLPATVAMPQGKGVFRAIPNTNNAQLADLGMWSIYANPNYPEVQATLQQLQCGKVHCDATRELPKTIATFRTPSLRDLGHSWPYLHTGRMATVEDMLHFYMRMSDLERSGQLRNGAPELAGVRLDEADAAAVEAFLRSLDEDYDN